MASHQGGPSRIGTPAPLSPLPTTGNLDHLVSLFHQTAADLGLPAAGFPPITPANISILSIGEQLLLPLLYTSLQSSVHIASALENLSTAIVTGAHYRVVNSKVVTAPKLTVEDKDRVNNSRRIKTVKLNIIKLKASLNKFCRGKLVIEVEGQTLKLK